jgi:copper resistance protein B
MAMAAALALASLCAGVRVAAQSQHDAGSDESPLHAASGESPSHATPGSSPSHPMLEDPFNHSVVFDRFETRDAEGGDVGAWDMNAWFGRAFDRLAIRSEGERTPEGTDQADVELLWAHTFARWWDFVAGARADFEPSPTQTWGAIGVQGLAPYRFELEGTVYLGDGGDAAARFAAEYELLITQRLILQPRVELNWYGQEDAARGIGAGLATSEAGLRLRYELRREIAPYLGIVREHKHGGTEELAQLAGQDPNDTRWVLGIRARF